MREEAVVDDFPSNSIEFNQDSETRFLPHSQRQCATVELTVSSLTMLAILLCAHVQQICDPTNHPTYASPAHTVSLWAPAPAVLSYPILSYPSLAYPSLS